MTARLTGSLFFSLAMIVAAVPVRADIANLVSTQDNTLFQDQTLEVSSGSGPTMYAGRTAIFGPGIRRALVKFDVAASIPPGSTIDFVELRLFMSQTISGSQPVTIHRVTNSWGEGASNSGVNGGQGAAAAPNDATWNYRFFNTTNWTNPGGDFIAAATATQNVVGIGAYVWASPGMIGEVQSWLDNPATNHGWLVKGNEDLDSTAKKFETRESATAINRPQLRISYTPPSVPVESSTWSRVKALLD
jgi:hypothetical protein